MALITWTENLSVHVPELDEQHKKLVQMLNQLHDAMQQGQGRDVLQRLLAQLVQYTATHFAAEEQLMQKANYSDFPQHKSEHDKLKSKVLDLKQRLESGESRLTVSVLQFLQNWLVNHIQGTDKKYAPILAPLAKV
jgi:hemerythrin